MGVKGIEGEVVGDEGLRVGVEGLRVGVWVPWVWVLRVGVEGRG